MDIETILIDNVHLGCSATLPYLLCWYDGKKAHYYFIKSLDKENLNQNILDMISNAMNDICIKRFDNYRIYLHNFSKFDGYFLVKNLANLGICTPIINNGKIISLDFTHTNDFSVTFNDSYLLLLGSLRKLGKTFQCNTQKTIFPYLLDNINYIGDFPDFKYFTNLSIEEYNKYKESFTNKIWNFRTEAMIYCRIDCISLYEILIKFN